jgi:hypothetical protein
VRSFLRQYLEPAFIGSSHDHRNPRHCEERSDEAIHGKRKLDCFASLAMTNRSTGLPLSRE